MFPKLVKMSVLLIKINFSQRYIASHVDKYLTALIENLPNISGKHRRQTLAAAFLDLCSAFYIVFVKRT